MKKLLFIFPLLFCFFGCEKDNNHDDDSISIIGEWRIINWEITNVVVTSYVDPINGNVTILDSSIVDWDYPPLGYQLYINSPSYSFNFKSDGQLNDYGDYTIDENSLYIQFGVFMDEQGQELCSNMNEYNISLLNNNNLSFSGTNLYPRSEFIQNPNVIDDCYSYYVGDTLFESVLEEVFEFEKVQ
jgi:hypothetical protein